MINNLDDLYQGLLSIGLDVAYYEFEEEEEPQLPFIVYYQESEVGFYADNIRYTTALDCMIELYSEVRDQLREEMIEKLFTANGIGFEKAFEPLPDEELIMTLYQVRIPFKTRQEAL